MVQNLVGLGLAFVELLEAEAARLKLNVRQTLITAALVVIGAVLVAALLTAASGFLLWAAYLALLPSVGPAWAALILGAAIWVVVGGGAWLVANRMRSS